MVKNLNVVCWLRREGLLVWQGGVGQGKCPEAETRFG